MLKKRMMPAVMLSTMLLASCTTKTTVVDTSCTAFETIGYACNAVSDDRGNLIDCGNGRDTVTTVKSIREHNAAYDSLCE